MSLGLILVIILIIFLLDGFSGRFGAMATVSAMAGLVSSASSRSSLSSCLSWAGYDQVNESGSYRQLRGEPIGPLRSYVLIDPCAATACLAV